MNPDANFKTSPLNISREVDKLAANIHPIIITVNATHAKSIKYAGASFNSFSN